MSHHEAEGGNQVTHESAAFNVVIIGLFILLFIFLMLMIYAIYLAATFDELSVTVLSFQFGYGTWFLFLLALVLFFITLGFLIYVLTLIDKTAEHGQSAREWAIACTITFGVTIMLLFIQFYLYYAFNAYVENVNITRIDIINKDTNALTYDQNLMLPTK